MTSENKKQGDEPQTFTSPQSDEELASFHLQDGTGNLVGISNREAGSVHHGQGMPFNVGVSLFHKQDYLNNPVSDYSVSIGNLKEDDLPAFGLSGASASINANDLDDSQTGRNMVVNGADVVRGLQTCRLGREYNGSVPLSVHNPTSGELGSNISWMDMVVRESNGSYIRGPWHTGNQFVRADCASISGHDLTVGEVGVSNFVITGDAQSNHPGEIDGDFLSHGCGTNQETDPKFGIHCLDSDHLSGRVLLPLFNTFPDQNIVGNSLNYSSSMANDSPSFPNCAGGHRRVRNEAPYRSWSLGQNASRLPTQVWRANQHPNPLPIHNVEGSFNPMLNMGRLSHQATATNRDNSLENNRVPNSAWFRATRMPSSSSMVGFTQPATVPLQNPPRTAVRIFSPEPVMVGPFTGVPGRMTRRGQSGPVRVPCNGVPRSMLSHVRPGPLVVPSLGPSRSIPWQGQSGQFVRANAVASAEATEGSSFSNNSSVQQAGKGILGQPQAPVSAKPLNSMRACAHTSVQEMHNVPQSSNIDSGPSRKRGASKILPIAPAVHRRKTRSRITSSPSMPRLNQVVPLVSSPSSSVNSFSRSLQRPAHLLESLLGTRSTDYIKWKEEDTDCPSGFHCPICKRDLSYKPDGPMYKRDMLQPTSVLPCGHYFHSYCLHSVTPADQAENPPCIPCALNG